MNSEGVVIGLSRPKETIVSIDARRSMPPEISLEPPETLATPLGSIYISSPEIHKELQYSQGRKLNTYIVLFPFLNNM
jgi:hypothetical protein